MNKIEFFKNEIKKKYIYIVFFSYGLNNAMTRKLFFKGGGGGGGASQEDIIGLAISLIFDQFSIL